MLHGSNTIIPHCSKSFLIGKRFLTGLAAMRVLFLNATMCNRAFSRSFSLFLGCIRAFFACCKV